jgi:hypothetical protein
VPDDELGGRLGEGPVDLPSLLASQVVGDPDVHASGTEVAVHDPGQPVVGQQTSELGEVVG